MDDAFQLKMESEPVKKRLSFVLLRKTVRNSHNIESLTSLIAAVMTDGELVKRQKVLRRKLVTDFWTVWFEIELNLNWITVL